MTWKLLDADHLPRITNTAERILLGLLDGKDPTFQEIDERLAQCDPSPCLMSYANSALVGTALRLKASSS